MTEDSLIHPKDRRNNIYHDDLFTKSEIDMLLAPILDKTFEELDVRHLFETQKGLTIQQMNKGIFGNIIEQCVLGMKPDSKPRPDIIVDYRGSTEAFRGVQTVEIKTTGVVEGKHGITPKERASVTGVAIGTIETETWEKSRYYAKLLHILWIFYLYKFKNGRTNERYLPYEQRLFRIINYGFQHLSDDEKELSIFQHDWQVIHDYLVLHQNDPREERETIWYPQLHTNTRAELVYTDIAPRYPHPPRLAFKNSYVSTVYEMLIRKRRYESLSFDFSSFEELNHRLHGITEKYSGKTIGELADIFNLPKVEKKNLTEPVAIHLFDSNIKHLNKIDVFCKAGIHLKTMTLTPSGKRTEDIKLFMMDVDEISNPMLDYYDTSYYSFFNEQRFLYILFEERDDMQPNYDHIFRGFKWVDFSPLETQCKETFDIIRDRLVNNTLVDEISMIKGKQSSAPNFPKSAEHIVFVRGASTTEVGKSWTVNGIRMYAQYIWVKGSYIADQLSNTTFI